MTTYEIRDSDVRHNIQVIKRKAGAPIWAVIKFDGYGVGLLHLAEILRQCGIENLAVSDAADVERLRNAGFTTERILLISQPGSDEEIETALENEAIFSVGSRQFAERLRQIAAQRGIPAEAHLTIDTGMGRFGFLPEDYEAARELFLPSEDLTVTGIYSHFFNSFSNDKATKEQFEVFMQFLGKLRADGIDPGMTHICNSAATFRYPEMHLDAVRVGSAIVGRVSGMTPKQTGLRKVGILKCNVCEVKFLPKGHQVGYGAKCQLRRDTKIAVISAGHWAGTLSVRMRDVLLRRFPSVRIGGKTAKMVCAPEMGHIIVDVTGMNVKAGDTVYMDISPVRVNGYVRRSYI